MDTDLILLTWPDYINPRTLEQFEAELGARVKVEVVPSAVEMMERMRMPDAPPDDRDAGAHRAAFRTASRIRR